MLLKFMNKITGEVFEIDNTESSTNEIIIKLVEQGFELISEQDILIKNIKDNIFNVVDDYIDNENNIEENYNDFIEDRQEDYNDYENNMLEDYIDHENDMIEDYNDYKEENTNKTWLDNNGLKDTIVFKDNTLEDK